jgi:hypothetical protein
MCCVLFERGVLFCVLCVFLWAVFYRNTTSTGKAPFTVQLNNNNNNYNNSDVHKSRHLSLC